MKQALGLAVSGTEVRVAHLVMHKGQIQIESLERARLMTTLEFQPAAVKAAEQNEAEPKDVFGLKENQTEGGTNGQNAYKRHAENIETVYGLVEKFARKKKMKVAFNVPVSMVNYIREGSLFATQTSMDRTNGADRETGPNWALQPIKSPDGDVEHFLRAPAADDVVVDRCPKLLARQSLSCSHGYQRSGADQYCAQPPRGR